MFSNHSDFIRHNPAQSYYGAAVTDLDGDGDFELVVACNGGDNLALKPGSSGFESIADNTLADGGCQAIGLAAGDFDADGREELYILNTDTFNGVKSVYDRLFDWRDKWIDLFSLPEHMSEVNLTAGRSVACIDRMGTGKYGFFVANYGGPMALYELNEAGEVENVASQAGVALSTGGRALLCLPLLPGSTHMDIFAANEGGANFLFRNRGDGTFEELGQESGLGDMYEHARGVSAVDLDGNARFGIAIANWEGPNRLYVWDKTRFRDTAPRRFAGPARARSMVAADFDNDGNEELFINVMGQPNRLFGWREDRWQPLELGDALEEDGTGTGAVAGDFDHDGRLELILAHGESSHQPLSYYHTADQGNHWLRIQPLTQYGAPARGSVVRLSAGGRTQIKHVDAGSGYLCQMEPIAHFGLGQIDKVDWVEVMWPGGTKHHIEKPSPDQTLRVDFPTG